MPLTDFSPFSFEEGGATRDVYTRGTGPGVVVIHEIPGITPAVARFATRVSEAGLPRLRARISSARPASRTRSRYVLSQITRACVSREFAVLARRESSPITHWLRALCRRAHAECGGPGVGALGMCLTGNFALALMVDPSVMAPVLSQPSLPFGSRRRIARRCTSRTPTSRS